MKNKSLFTNAIITLMMSTIVICASCGNHSKEATVTNVYQRLISGSLVHTWIEVRFDDNSTANVMLPDDDKIWDKARKMKNKKVKIKKQKDNWQFVGFLE